MYHNEILQIKNLARTSGFSNQKFNKISQNAMIEGTLNIHHQEKFRNCHFSSRKCHSMNSCLNTHVCIRTKNFTDIYAIRYIIDK